MGAGCVSARWSGPAAPVSLGLLCRLRIRYLLLAISDAAWAQNYNLAIPIQGRVLEKLRLWVGPLAHLPEEPM